MKKKKRPFLTVLFPALLVCVALIAVYVLTLKRYIAVFPHRPETAQTPVHDGKSVRKDTDASHKRDQRPVKEARKASCLPRVAIIIDDLGYHRHLDIQLIRLDLPLSFAILPSAPFTDVVAREAARQGQEIMLHQPMEPKDYPCVEPGPGAFLLSMNDLQLKKILHENLRKVPGARGVNNHMGSSFTESREKMALVLRELKKLGLFYIDSRTTNGTVGLQEAKKAGVPAAQRTVFLDNTPEPEAIHHQMEYLIRVARQSGSAIGIGHPYAQTLEILREYQNGMKGGVTMVAVSQLVK